MAVEMPKFYTCPWTSKRSKSIYQIKFTCENRCFFFFFFFFFVGGGGGGGGGWGEGMELSISTKACILCTLEAPH